MRCRPLFPAPPEIAWDPTKTYKMTKVSTQTLLFSLLLAMPLTALHAGKATKCFVDGLNALAPLGAAELKILDAFVKDRYLTENRQAADIPKEELFGQDDSKLQESIEKVLRSYKLLPAAVKKVVDECFPKNGLALLECKRKFPKEGCEEFGPFIAAKRCPQGQESLDYVYCVPTCPSGYETSEADKFVCVKKPGFSLQIGAHIEATEGDVVTRKSCPENYATIGDFICIQKCPLGWIDLGTKCEKPIYRRRDFETFYYRHQSKSE